MSQNDNTEYEAKILNIDEGQLLVKLRQVGAQKVDNYQFRRYVFDTIPAAESRWVRLRSNGKKTTLTVKEIQADTIDGTQEWEIEVSDMDACLAILEKIGITHRGYQENLRTEYKLGDVEISIDKWPKLSPYVEIEGRSKEAVVKTAKLLGFSEDSLTSRNTESLYEDIGVSLKQTRELKF